MFYQENIIILLIIHQTKEINEQSSTHITYIHITHAYIGYIIYITHIGNINMHITLKDPFIPYKT